MSQVAHVCRLCYVQGKREQMNLCIAEAHIFFRQILPENRTKVFRHLEI